MLSRDGFKKHIEDIIKCSNTFVKIEEASCGAIQLWELPLLVSNVTELLSFIMGDNDNDWISYWLWELNFGEDYRPGCVVDSDGKDIPLKTIDDLYDLLVDNCKAKGALSWNQ